MSNKSSLASPDAATHLMQVDDANLSDTDRQSIDFLPIPDTKSDSDNARTDSFYSSTDIEYLLYQLAKSSMEANLWDHLFPRYELQILSMALHTQRTWAQFLESATRSKKKVFLTNHDNDRASTSIASGSRKSMNSTPYKSGSKFGTRTKKGSQLARRKGSRSFKVINQIKKLELPESETEIVLECLETLLTRVQTVLFDTIIEEVIFPHEKRFDFLPIQESIKQEFGALSVVYDVDPYFTLEDIHEFRDDDFGESESKQSFFVPLLPVPKWEAPSSAVSPSASKMGVSKNLSLTPSSIRSKRKVQSREIRNLLQDAKVSRKWERVNILGISDELKTFLESIDNVFQQIKKCKEHFIPFSKYFNKSETSDSGYLDAVESPLDVQTLLTNLENNIYFSKSDFQRDLDIMFLTALSNSKDDDVLVEHIQELRKLTDELMVEVKEEDFAEEHDLLKDMLPQIFPEMHNIRDKDDEMSDQGTEVPSGRFKKRSKRTLTNEQAKEMGENSLTDSGKWIGHKNQEDTTERALFYQEDPALTKWKNEVRTYLQAAKKKKEMGGAEGAANTDDSIFIERTCHILECVEMGAKSEDNKAEKNTAAEGEENKLTKQNKGVTTLKSPLVPNPLFELPSVYLFPFQWHIATTNWPNLSLASELEGNECIDEDVNDSNCPFLSENLAESSDTRGQLVNTIIARNKLLIQRAPKYADALLKSSTFPAQAVDGVASKDINEADDCTINVCGEDDADEHYKQQPGAGVNKVQVPSGPTDNAMTEQYTASLPVQDMGFNSSVDTTSNDKASTAQATVIENAGKKSKSAADFSVSSLLSSCPNEVRMKNVPRVQANRYDAFRTLDQQVAPDLLKQSVALQLSLAGFQSTSDQGLNVLTELASAFIERIGFLMTTFLAMPNSTTDMLEILNRTMLEVYSYGLETIIDLTVARIIKTENQLQTANLDVIQRFVTNETLEKLEHFQEKVSTTEDENLESTSTDSVYFYVNAPFTKRTKFKRCDRSGENFTYSAVSHWENDESNSLNHHGTFIPQQQHTSSNINDNDSAHMTSMQSTCALPRQQQQQQSTSALPIAPFKSPHYSGTDDQQRVTTYPGMQLKGVQKRYSSHSCVPIQMGNKHSNYLINQQEPLPKTSSSDSGSTSFLTNKNNSNYTNQQNTSNLSTNQFSPHIEVRTPRQQQPNQLSQNPTSRAQSGYLQNVYPANVPHYSTQNYQSQSPHSSPTINVQIPSNVHEKHDYVLNPSILPSTPALYKQEKPSSISIMSPIQKDEITPVNQPGNIYQPNPSLSQNVGPEGEGGIVDDKKKARTARNRRSGGHINYNDGYYYNEDSAFEDSIEDKPKRKRRRTSSKSKK